MKRDARPVAGLCPECLQNHVHWSEARRCNICLACGWNNAATFKVIRMPKKKRRT